MSARDFDNKIGTGVKPAERTKMGLVGIQKKIQNLHSDSSNSKTNNSLSQIDLSHQLNGIYIIRVNDCNQSYNQRLIKQ